MPHATDELIAEIHAAATDSTRWQAVVDRMHHMLPSCGIAISGYDIAANSDLGICIAGWPDDTVANYVSYYASISPFIPAFQKSPVGRPLTDLQLVPWSESIKSEFFNDFLARSGFGGGTAMKLLHDEQRFFQLTIDFDYRLRETMEPLHQQIIQSVAPHLHHSFTTMRRLGNQRFNRSTVDSIMNRIPAMAFVLDRRQKIMAVNQAGADALRSADVVTAKQKRINFLDHAAQKFIDQSMERLGANLLDGLELSHVAKGHLGRSLVMLCPLPPEHEAADRPFHLADHSAPFVLLTLTDLDKRVAADITAIGRLFKLTAAESKLASSLLAGQDLREFAETQGVSIHTARNQLKSIFAKTGTTRQVELALVLNRI
jgi:DNA-binding CsgD family transcriptional regulator